MSALDGLRVVSWDVDGTLYELPALRRALRRLALARGLTAPLATARAVRALVRTRRAFEAVRRRGGDLTGVAAPAERALADALVLDAVRAAGLRPGVREALARQRAAGLALVATSDHPAAAKLEALGLGGCFDRVVVGEDLGALKPSPRLLLAACGDLPPAALLHVGDRPDTDGVAAAAAGCRVRLLGPGPVPADLLEEARA